MGAKSKLEEWETEAEREEKEQFLKKEASQ